MKTLSTLALSTIFICSLYTQSFHSDCGHAIPLSQMGNYRYDQIAGVGDEVKEMGHFKDGYTITESNALWLSWEILEDGDFYFDIIPLDAADDIDFILYETAGTNCEDILPVRSVLSGRNVHSPYPSEPCSGSTGLSRSSDDTSEESGCQLGDDNYVQHVNARAGDRYFLLINNYYNANGFKFHFAGSATLRSGDSGFIASDFFYLDELVTYPNPVVENLTIRLPQSVQPDDQIIIINSSGRIARSISVHDPSEEVSISAQHLIAGTYFVTVKRQNQVVQQSIFVKS